MSPSRAASTKPADELERHPPTWAIVRLQELATLVNGFAFGPRHWKRSGLPIVRIQNLNDPEASFNYCDERLPEKFRIRTGELLFAWSGTPGTSFGAHIWKGGEAWLNQHIFKVEFDRTLLDTDYLRAAIDHNLSKYIAKAQGGSGLAHINKTAMDASPILVAPLNEQRRIVAAIAELFVEISEGEEALRRARANFKHYLVSVLRAAVDGTLTAEWRAQMSSAQERQHRSFSKSPVLTNLFQIPEPSSVPNTALDSPTLPPLPESWVWSTVERVGDVRLGRQRSPKRRSGSSLHPYLRVANVFEDRIDATSILWMPFTPTELTTYRLADGDVLLNEGQSLQLVGRPAIYRGEVPGACFQNTLIRFRAKPLVLPEYALIVFRSYLHSNRFQRAAKWTTNIAHLSVGRFAAMEFPLPPLKEQQRIVDQVKDNLSNVRASELAIDDGLTRSQYLRQNALRRAFEGNLVPQDPSDEPATDLSERIRQSMARKRAEPKPPRLRREQAGTTIMNSRNRRPILEILKVHPKGITPEDLLHAAGYDLNNVDEFYAALRPLWAQIDEHRPPAKRVHLWPKNADITLGLKRE